MNKRNFLKAAGLAGIATLIPFGKAKSGADETNTCTLIPSETAGPFPLDLSANTFYFRQDLSEDRTGTPLNLRLRIMGANNCAPMPNVRINIWHCDKDGNYSGYSSEAGLTYLRGYQMTDANGEVNFTTIFPGWYPGRVCHIHFQVYVSSAYAAISQLTFDHDVVNEVYAANTAEYTNGADPKTPNTDGIFSDGYAFQLASLTPNSTGGYDSFLEVIVQGNGTVGVGYIEQQNAQQFVMAQNYPNPAEGKTTIPLTLKKDAQVSLEIWDTNGKQVANIEQGKLSAGEHHLSLDLNTLGLSPAVYVYQISVTNQEGTFKDCKAMTIYR